MEIIKNLDLLSKARGMAVELVRSDFKNDNDLPFVLSEGQADIFLLIFIRFFKRCLAMTYTQYGKSDVVSMALIERSQSFAEPWTIVAGKQSKGMLIMKKVIQHTFDTHKFMDQLNIDKDVPLERLKRERSKESITWKVGGGVRAISANTSNRNQIQEALIGEGSRNLILEEAPFVPDSSYAMVMRMTMGDPDNFVMKLGNAFKRNHFYRSVKSDKWAKVIVDWKRGVSEGRITEEQIDEVKDLPFFDELYNCQFPKKESYTTDGYTQLITDELLESAFISLEEAQEKGMFEGRVKLGGDFAGGGSDRSAYVLRWKKVMLLNSTNKIADIMQQVPIVMDLIKKYKIEANDVGLDYGGLGQGASDRLWEKDIYVNKVMFGSSAPEEEKKKYANMRAYMYYRLLRWLKKGGRIVRDDGFLELLSVNYKSDSERKLKIQPKEDLKKVMKDLGVKASSPDIGDASVLTFADNSKLVTEDDFGFV